MGKSVAAAMTFEEMKPSKKVSRKAITKLTNDITLLSTSEILHRLYKRHAVGVWQTVTAAVIAAAIWVQLA